ncbi:MAG TPA: cation:dicarboxylase symporter family transporter [Gemmatimonadaceae bacterium]|jgi:Na+/H+-dicarboxylate symporter|nr:cation:dicarboxylase symporter family transporter [Gemmatimonadaceae bacterium]
MRAHRVVIGLLAGLVFGSAIGAVDGAVALRVAGVLEPIGTLWVNAIRMTVVPLVMSLLFVSVATHESAAGMGRLTATTIATFVALLVFAAVVALLLAPPLIADMKLAPDMAERLRATASANAGQAAAQVTRLPGFAAWVTSLVPVNAVKAAADGAMLPLIVFTVLFGLASRQIEPSLRDALVSFFGAIVGATTTIVEWIIFAAPVGVFALVAVAASRAGIALAGAMAYYILAISALLVLFALLTYPVASILGRIPLGWFTRAVLPAQAVALSSSSSLASLPALVEGARALGLPVSVGGFVLPLSVSTFKVATPISWLLGTLFLAKLYGVTLASGAVLSIAFLSVVLSLTIPGVPQGAVLLLAPVLVQYGIPAEGVALLLAADTIPDLVGTMTNVTGDMVVGAVVARRAVAEVPSVAPSSADA